MKKALIFILLIASCTPIRYVDVQARHNYYERHRFNTYTAPVFIPGKGVVLQTQRIPLSHPKFQPRPIRRGKH